MPKENDWESDKPWITGGLKELREKILLIEQKMITTGDWERYKNDVEQLEKAVDQCQKQIYKWAGGLALLMVIISTLIALLSLVVPMLYIK